MWLPSELRVKEGQKPPYWLTNEILILREDAQRKMRSLLLRARTYGRDVTILSEGDKAAKKLLCREIKREKRSRWRNLCDHLDLDPFGNAYRIVINQLRLSHPRIIMSREEKLKQANHLFVEAETERRRDGGNRATAEPFQRDELKAACGRIKNKKAPGPDGLTPEVVNSTIGLEDEYFLGIFNKLLLNNTFLKSRKKGKLVLISKPRKPEEETVK